MSNASLSKANLCKLILKNKIYIGWNGFNTSNSLRRVIKEIYLISTNALKKSNTQMYASNYCE